MQIIHNDFKIDLRSHPSTLSLGEGGSKTKQKGKKKISQEILHHWSIF